MSLTSHFYVLIIVVTVIQGQTIVFPSVNDLGRPCSSPEGGQGICQMLSTCRRSSPQTQENICGFIGSEVIVCCDLEHEDSTTISSQNETLPLLFLNDPHLVTTNPPSSPQNLSTGIGPIVSVSPHSLNDPVHRDTPETSGGNERRRECGIPTSGTQPQRKPRRVRRIVGGADSSILDFPWIVTMRETNSTDPTDVYSNVPDSLCGGVLIHPHYILTAAHCFKRNITHVTVGGQNDIEDIIASQDINIDKVHIYPKYTPSTMYHDLAVIQLSTPAYNSNDSNSLITSICLSNNASNHSNIESVTIGGWGKLSFVGVRSTKLQVLKDVPTVSKSKCESSYVKSDGCPLCRLPNGIPEYMLCVGDVIKGRRSACQGDSGGPAMIFNGITKRWMLVGTIIGGNGCGHPDFPTLITNIDYYTDWIYNIINK